MPLRSRLPRRAGGKSISLATHKAPLACPFCEARKLVRKGTRRRKFELVQL